MLRAFYSCISCGCWLNAVPYLQGMHFELDDEMASEDEDRFALQDIVNNAKLSEGYLTLAREIEVMEPKSPEDIYKVWILKHTVQAADFSVDFFKAFIHKPIMILLFSSPISQHP